MLEHWFLLALAAGVFSVLFNTLNRHHLQKGNDSTAYAWWFEFYRACFFAVFLFFDFQFSFSWQNLIALLMQRELPVREGGGESRSPRHARLRNANVENGTHGIPNTVSRCLGNEIQAKNPVQGSG